jgi:pimeloyl-ACP methyl ester carboxylesterase
MAALLVAGLVATAPAIAQQVEPAAEPALPIVFVHGGAGSAAQYQSQAMRFASNDYPNLVTGIDRTSSSSASLSPMLDEFFDDVMAQTGADQIYAVAHSLGTGLMNNYLNSSPERSARIAKYISIDGAPANCGSITTQCLNITAASMTQGHTQSVTSPESFARQYEFFTGAQPATTDILPESTPAISGKAINFPANTGPGEGTMQVWEVDAQTGHRTSTTPYASFTFASDSDGSWGPLAVDPEQHYEFEVQRSTSELTGHYYMQPFIRSNHLIRFLVSPPDSPILTNTDVSDNHSAVVTIRYKEWWGNHPTAGNDSLKINTTSASGGTQPPVELINAATAPTSKFAIGIHIFDEGTDATSNTGAPIPFFFSQFFQTGVDVFMPAADPPDGTIHLVNAPRGDVDQPQVINVANWASSNDRIVVEFNDYVATEPALPIVFVHGASGSAAQYQSQEQRFGSNDYANLVTGLDRISADHAEIAPILDDFFADVMAQTGDDQIYVVAHSQGVSVMNNYLNSSSERAARVAKYIGIDSGSGLSPDVCPGNVPCKGIWAQGDPARVLGPYNNVQFPDQAHTQAVVSPESFVEQYRFFTGNDPTTSDVVPEAEPEIGGRAINFPANTGPGEATLEVWEVDGETGHRTTTTPYASFDIAADSDGSWGPLAVDPDQHYEFSLHRTGADVTGHYYREPFIRSNHLIRLLVAPQIISDFTDKSDEHSALVAIRYKEWWGDRPSEPDDSLRIGTASPSGGTQPSVEVINAATAPVSRSAIGIHTFDAGIDQTTNVNAPIPFFFSLPFQTGVDVFMPASAPPDGSITLRSVPRDATDREQVINVANWASSTDRMAVEFNDYASGPRRDTFTARYSEQMCAALTLVADALGFASVEELVRTGVNGFRGVAEAGGSFPIANAPANVGPCEISVTWPADQLDALSSAAAAWGVSEDQLHHLGGRVVLVILYIAIVNAGG